MTEEQSREVQIGVLEEWSKQVKDEQQGCHRKLEELGKEESTLLTKLAIFERMLDDARVRETPIEHIKSLHDSVKERLAVLPGERASVEELHQQISALSDHIEREKARYWVRV